MSDTQWGQKETIESVPWLLALNILGVHIIDLLPPRRPHQNWLQRAFNIFVQMDIIFKFNVDYL